MSGGLSGGRANPQHLTTPVDPGLADAFVALLTDPGRRGPASTRMQLIAVADVERLRGDNPTGVAEIVGGEALPQTVLERLMSIATVTGVVFDGKGQPIWVGRDRRFPTEAQIKAIIARDRHCTGCAADPERCEIHHIVPWEQGGLTDIDKMCLACPACHHNIHDRGYIVTKTNTGYKIINPTNYHTTPNHPARTGRGACGTDHSVNSTNGSPSGCSIGDSVGGRSMSRGSMGFRGIHKRPGLPRRALCWCPSSARGTAESSPSVRSRAFCGLTQLRVDRRAASTHGVRASVAPWQPMQSRTVTSQATTGFRSRCSMTESSYRTARQRESAGHRGES